MAKKINKLMAALAKPVKSKKTTKKDIPSAFDMKTGVDVGKSKKTMPKGMPKKTVKGGSKMPMKDKMPMSGKMPMKSMMMKGKKSC